MYVLSFPAYKISYKTGCDAPVALETPPTKTLLSLYLFNTLRVLTVVQKLCLRPWRILSTSTIRECYVVYNYMQVNSFNSFGAMYIGVVIAATYASYSSVYDT